MPLLEAGFDVEARVRVRPIVNFRQMRERRATFAAHARKAHVFDFMARGAEREESRESLHVAYIIVLKNFMALDRPTLAPSTADFADVTGARGNDSLELVPILFRDDGAHVAKPGRLRNQLDG